MSKVVSPKVFPESRGEVCGECRMGKTESGSVPGEIVIVEKFPGIRPLGGGLPGPLPDFIPEKPAAYGHAFHMDFPAVHIQGDRILVDLNILALREPVFFGTAQKGGGEEGIRRDQGDFLVELAEHGGSPDQNEKHTHGKKNPVFPDQKAENTVGPADQVENHPEEEEIPRQIHENAVGDNGAPVPDDKPHASQQEEKPPAKGIESHTSSPFPLFFFV